MRLKPDENLSIRLKDPLVSLGFDVCTVFDEGLCGASDISVAQAATEEERILLTLDVEFADLRKHSPGTHPGVVLFRPRSSGPLEIRNQGTCGEATRPWAYMIPALTGRVVAPPMRRGMGSSRGWMR